MYTTNLHNLKPFEPHLNHLSALFIHQVNRPIATANQLFEWLQNMDILAESPEEKEARLAQIELCAKDQHREVLNQILARRTQFENISDAWNSPVPNISKGTKKRLERLEINFAIASTVLIGIPLLGYMSQERTPRKFAQLIAPPLFAGTAGYILSKGLTKVALGAREVYWRICRVATHLIQTPLSIGSKNEVV